MLRAEARRGQQTFRFGLAAIERPIGPIGSGAAAIDRQARRHEAVRRPLTAAQQLVGDEVAVDGHRQGLTDAHVFQRRVVQVEGQVGHPAKRRDVQVVVHAGAAQVSEAVGLDGGAQVEFAVANPAFGRNRVGRGVERDFVEAGFLRAPEYWVTPDQDLVAQLPGHEAVGSVADVVRRLGPGVAPLFHHVARLGPHRADRTVLRQQQPGVFEMDHQGVRVGRLDPEAGEWGVSGVDLFGVLDRKIEESRV